MTQKIDISAEAVKAWLDQHTRLFMHAWYGLAREEQKQTLDMLAALSAERVRLLQEAFDNAQDAYHTGVERDAQTKRANEGWQNALDNANELYRIRQERDALKATQARLVSAAEAMIDVDKRYEDGTIPKINARADLIIAVAAARETM